MNKLHFGGDNTSDWAANRPLEEHGEVGEERGRGRVARPPDVRGRGEQRATMTELDEPQLGDPYWMSSTATEAVETMCGFCKVATFSMVNAVSLAESAGCGGSP